MVVPLVTVVLDVVAPLLTDVETISVPGAELKTVGVVFKLDTAPAVPGLETVPLPASALVVVFELS